MGLRSKSQKKELRKKKKLAEKAARRALYAKFAAEGKTQGSRRANAKTVRLAKDTDHPDGRCGNIGCRKCFPHLNKDRIRLAV